MKLTTLVFVSSVASAPTPQFDIGALFGGVNAVAGLSGINGLDWNTILSGLTSLFAPPPANTTGPGGLLGLLSGLGGVLPGASAPASNSASLFGGLGGLLGSAPPPATSTGAPAASGAAPGGADLLGGLGGLLSGGAGTGGLDLGALAGAFLGGSGSGPTGDVNVIVTQYGNIKDKVTKMDTFVKTIGDKAPADLIAQLNKGTADQVEVLKAATKAIDAMAGQVDLMGAAGLLGPGGELTSAVQTAMESLKKAFPVISKVPGAREAELANLKTMLEAAKAFTEAVNKKLPSLAASIGQGEGQKAVDYLNDAINTFSKT